ncbi:hypothetical protein E5161_00365 [Cohnella pontilimi]|uniref:Lipoprotein n=1 Tax=Cohnella pontilimi TaxID=2564100 RepID=A0A4U0FG94_9BACL|nr:hypothetical protein [Cohnella pontilimi]TJY43898.1 hypothetical protein E5161_00365 [Cohnella pontilimi]
MWRPLILFSLIGLLLVGCGSIKTFQGRVYSIKDGVFIVDCSDEINKGKGKNVNSLGYLCQVKLTNNTKYLDENGTTLKITDFPLESNVKLVLVQSENIKKVEKGKQLNLVARKVILLNK